MFGQAVALVLAGSIYPAGLVMVAVYLATSRPTLLAWLFLAGAVTTTVVSGVLLLSVLRGANLDHPENSGTLGGVRLLFGLVFTVLGLSLLRHRSRVSAVALTEAAVGSNDTDAPGAGDGDRITGADQSAKPGMLARFQKSPRPGVAFLAGMVVYVPGPGYLAAVQVIGSSHSSLAEMVAVFVVVVVLDLWLVWLPLVTYWFAPARTGTWVRGFSDWLARNGRLLTAAVLVGIGGFLVATGIDALLS